MELMGAVVDDSLSERARWRRDLGEYDDDGVRETIGQTIDVMSERGMNDDESCELIAKYLIHSVCTHGYGPDQVLPGREDIDMLLNVGLVLGKVQMMDMPDVPIVEMWCHVFEAWRIRPTNAWSDLAIKYFTCGRVFLPTYLVDFFIVLAFDGEYTFSFANLYGTYWALCHRVQTLACIKVALMIMNSLQVNKKSIVPEQLGIMRVRFCKTLEMLKITHPMSLQCIATMRSICAFCDVCLST